MSLVCLAEGGGDCPEQPRWQRRFARWCNREPVSAGKPPMTRRPVGGFPALLEVHVKQSACRHLWAMAVGRSGSAAAWDGSAAHGGRYQTGYWSTVGVIGWCPVCSVAARVGIGRAAT